MNRNYRTAPVWPLVLLLAASLAVAEPRLLTVAGEVVLVEGSYGDVFAPGQPHSGSFVFDTDEANADEAITTPGTVPGHEFTSKYGFNSPPYGMALTFPAIDDGVAFDLMLVVVNDNLVLTADETNGAVSDGTYDWLEITGSSTVDYCPLPGGCTPEELIPADGQEWTLALIGNPAWFSDGSLIPDSLPPTLTAFVIGVEIDVDGEETGVVFASAEISSIPTLLFEDAATMSWPQIGGAQSYNVYRRSFGPWLDVDGDGHPDADYGDCVTAIDPDPTDTQFTDATLPLSGSGLAYLMAGVDTLGIERFLGSSSLGIDRSAALPCP